jgi:hypothetical protein
LEEEITRPAEEEPATDADQEEKKLSSLERLMVQGVTRISDLAKLLGVSKRKTLSMRGKILNEWEETASSGVSARSIGRFFRKAELVERTAWSLLSEEEESTEKKTNVLKVILSAIEKEIAVLGLCGERGSDEERELSGQKIAECERKVEYIIQTIEKSCDKSGAH